MAIIKQFPHCDPRVLHAPGICVYCDSYGEWQELRTVWQIAFTGQTPRDLDAQLPSLTQGAVLPCPATFIRGEGAQVWGGNRPRAYDAPDL